MRSLLYHILISGDFHFIKVCKEIYKKDSIFELIIQVNSIIMITVLTNAFLGELYALLLSRTIFYIHTQFFKMVLGKMKHSVLVRKNQFSINWELLQNDTLKCFT